MGALSEIASAPGAFVIPAGMTAIYGEGDQFANWSDEASQNPSEIPYFK